MAFPDASTRQASLWLAFALLAAGCGGDGLERAAVSGKVTLDGQPLAKGDIQFVPKDGDSRGAAWTKVVDGSYSIPASDGPAPGAYVVSITPQVEVEGAAPAPSPDEAPGDEGAGDAGPSVVYTPTSPLEATISAGQPNSFDFGLTSAKAPRARRR